MELDANGNYRGVIPGLPAASVVQSYVEGLDAIGAHALFPARGPQSRALYEVNDGQAPAGRLHNLRLVMLLGNGILCTPLLMS